MLSVITTCHRHFARLVFALVLLGAIAPAHAQDKAAVVEIGLVHVNDVYQIGAIDPKAPRGGLARLAGLVDTLRREHPATLFVFGGDTLSPGVESGMFKGAQMMRAWNAMRLDLAVPGNHEFDFGDDVARERLGESRFPWLAANLHAEPPLPAVKGTRIFIGSSCQFFACAHYNALRPTAFGGSMRTERVLSFCSRHDAVNGLIR